MGIYDDMYDGLYDEIEVDQPTVVGERGTWGDIGTGLLRGVNRVIGLGAEAAEAVGLENSVDEWAEENAKTSEWLAPDVSEYQSGTSFFGEVAETLSTSIGASAPSAAAGATIGSFMGPGGTAVGGIIGGLVGMGTVFGLGTGHQEYEKGIAEGLSEEEAKAYGFKKGAVEAGLESVAMVADIWTAGIGGKALKAGMSSLRGALKTTVPQLAKGYGVMLAAENTTELAQNELAHKIDQEYGLTTEDLTWADRLHTMAIASTVGMIFGTVGSAYSVNEKRKLASDLQSDNLDKRYAAAKVIKGQMEKQGLTEEAANFDKVISDATKSKIPIRIDEDIARKAEEITSYGQSEEGAEAIEERKMDKAMEPRDRKTAAILEPATPENMEEVNKVLEEADIPTGATLEAQYAEQKEQDQERLQTSVVKILEAQAEQKEKQDLAAEAGKRDVTADQMDVTNDTRQAQRNAADRAQVKANEMGQPGPQMDTSAPPVESLGYGAPQYTQAPVTGRTAPMTDTLQNTLAVMDEAKADTKLEKESPLRKSAMGTEVSMVEPKRDPVDKTKSTMEQVGYGAPVYAEAPISPDKKRKVTVTEKLKANMELQKEAQAKQKLAKQAPLRKSATGKGVYTKAPVTEGAKTTTEKVREVSFDKQEKRKKKRAYVSPKRKVANEGIPEKDVQAAKGVLRAPSGTSTPEEVAAAKDVLKKAGVKAPKAVSVTKESAAALADETTWAQEKIVEDASPLAKDLLKGNWKKGSNLRQAETRVHQELVGQWEDNGQEGSKPTAKDARTKILEQLYKSDPEAVDMMDVAMAEHEEKPENASENRTEGNIFWKKNELGAHGTAKDGTRFFVQKERKDRHLLFKEGEQIFPTDKDGNPTYMPKDNKGRGGEKITWFPSRDAAIAESRKFKSDYGKPEKVGANQYQAVYKGKRFGPKFRTAWQAEEFGKRHAKNPNLGIATTKKEIQNMVKPSYMAMEDANIPEMEEWELFDEDSVDAYLEEEYGVIEEAVEMVESEYGMIPKQDDTYDKKGKVIELNKGAAKGPVGLFKGLLEMYGITSPDVFVVEAGDFMLKPSDVLRKAMDNGAGDWIEGVLWSQDGSVFNTGGKSVAATAYDPDSNQIIMIVNNANFAKLSKPAQAQIIAHETGHILEKTAFHRADPKVQEEIVNEYITFLKKTLKDKLPSMTREQLHLTLRPSIYGPEIMGQNHKDKNALQTLSEEYIKYGSSFSEWFADNVAKWATTTNEPVSLVDKFFQGLGKVLVDLYNRVVKRNFKNAPTPKMKEFLNDHVAKVELMEELGMPMKVEENTIENIDYHFFHEQLGHERNVILGFVDSIPELEALEYIKAETEREKGILGAKKGIVAETPEERAANYKRIATNRNKVGKSWRKMKEDMVKTTKDFLKSGIDTIEGYSPAIGRQVNKYVKGVNERNAERKKLIAGFGKEYTKLTGEEQVELSQYLYNGHKEGIDRITKGKPELKREIENARKVLAEVRKEAESVGWDVKEELENYWPRSVDDSLGLRNFLNGTPEGGRIQAQVAEAKRTAENNGVEWTGDMENAVIDQMMTNGQYYGALSIPKALKKRGIDKLTSPMLEYYTNPVQALTNHILEMNEKIGQQELLGARSRKAANAKLKQLELRMKKNPKGSAMYMTAAKEYASQYAKLNDPSVEGSVMELGLASKINSMAKKSGLSDDQAMEIIDIVRARMMEKGMHGAMNTFRNVGLMATLGDFTSVITQSSEIILNMYENGPVNAITGLLSKKEISGAQLDLKQQMLEYQTEGSAKYLSKLLNMTGFSKVDILMKETFMQSALTQARKQKASEVRAKWEPYFGKEDTAALIKELESGKVGPLSTEMAWAKLMRYQPLDVIANPKAYATGGNMRVLYMLKTFQLRQANAIYREGIKKILSGNKAEGIKNLVWLTSLIVLGGATKDELRDMWLGREVPMGDHIWDNLLNIALLSKYDTDKWKQEGPAANILGNLVPATAAIDVPAKALLKQDPTQLLKIVPFIGKFAYDRFTEKGQTNQMNQVKGDFNKELKAAVRDNDYTKVNEIRERIVARNARVELAKQIKSSAIRKTISAEKTKMRKETKEKYESGGVTNDTQAKYKETLARLENGPVSKMKDNEMIAKNKAPEKGGGFDIGFGHKLNSVEKASGKIYGIPYKDGITVAQAKVILEKDMAKHRAMAARTLGKVAWDKLPEEAKILMTDYSFTGVLGEFKNFRRAIVTGDYSLAKKEYVRKMRNEEGKLIPLGDRNKFGLSMIESLKESGYLT